jgi:hypothetical protein
MTTQQQHDAVNHPAHYTQHPSGVECIAIAEHYTFNLGNALKYIWRAGLKSADPLEDLRKAAWYVRREINRLTARKKAKAARKRQAKATRKRKANVAPKQKRKRCRAGTLYRNKKGEVFTAVSCVWGSMLCRTADGHYFYDTWGDGSAFEEVAE